MMSQGTTDPLIASPVARPTLICNGVRRDRDEPAAQYGSSPDSLLEGNGFEISVPRWLATANSVGAFISVGEWRLLEPPKQLFRFAEADDRSGDSAASTIDRPQPDRSLETAAYLARN